MRGNKARQRRTQRRTEHSRGAARGVSKAPVSTSNVLVAGAGTEWDVADLLAAARGEAAVDTLEKMACAGCDHEFADHDGACGVDGCSCMSYVEPDGEDMAVEEQPGTVPDSANYRPAAGGAACADCAWFVEANGECEKWEAPVDAEYTCDSWTAEEESASSAIAETFVRIRPDFEAFRGEIESGLAEAIQKVMSRKGVEVLREAFRLEFADVELPAEHQPGATLPDEHPHPDTPAPPATAGAQWTAVFVPEATLTDDGRAMAPGSVSWRELPLSLMGLIETSAAGGHDGAVVCGRIDSIWREGNLIMASGVFDDSEYGQNIARMVADGTLRGVSVDLAIHDYEVGPQSDYFDADGRWVDKPSTEAPTDESPPDLVDLLFPEEPSEQVVFVVRSAVIGMSTVCPFPAFAEANISLVASGAVWRYTSPGRFTVTRQRPQEALTAAAVDPGDAEPVTDVSGLTAAAAGLAPVKPPVEWFTDPELDEPTALTVTDEGRVYGHAWLWDTCHIAYPNACTVAPRSESGYRYFLLKEVECADGERVAVGTVTLGTGHASLRRDVSQGEVLAHYDNTGTAVVDVVVGEDEFGGWVAGALRPDISEERARELMGATLSGDWRQINLGEDLELVALLAVNVPGFPVPRQEALIAAGETGGEVLALVAAGVPGRESAREHVRVVRDMESLVAEAWGFDDLVAEAQEQ